MKKMRLFFVLAVLVTVVFTSCSKDILSSPIAVDSLPKATISGYVTSEMNLQTAGAEFVPAGTQLLVQVGYSELNSNAVGTWKDTVTVGADGKYVASVPTIAVGVDVLITPFAFEADQVQPYGALSKSIKKTFKTDPLMLNVRPGQSISNNISFSSINLPNSVDKVSISGKVQANLNAEIVGLENVPNGTVINFYNATWKDSVTVQNGIYSIVVPTSTTVNWKVKFTDAKHVWVTNILSPSESKYQDVNYQYTITGSNSFWSNGTTNDLTAGEGVDLTVDPLANVVQLSGSVTAELNLLTPGLESVPDGTKITFYASDNSWGGTATVMTGKYSINIPKSIGIKYYSTFVFNKVVNATTTASTTYTLNSSISPYYGSTALVNFIAQ